MGSNPSSQTGDSTPSPPIITGNNDADEEIQEFEGIEDERIVPNHSEEGYPPPCPPQNKKADIVRSGEFTEIDAFAKKIVPDHINTMDELVKQLTQSFEKDIHKVRAIFVWLGAQPFSQRRYPIPVQINSPLGYLKRMAVGTMSYAEMFAVMCRLAEIPCMIVSGLAKSSAYEVGDYDVSNLYNVWNTVYLSGGWRIVFPLWALRAIVGRSTGNWPGLGVENNETSALKELVITTVKEHYFLTDPEEFIYRCLPDNDEWQLVKNPFSRQKFINVPYLRPKFFEYGLYPKDYEGIILAEKGICNIVITQNSEQTWLCPVLLYADRDSNGIHQPHKQFDKFTARINEGRDVHLIVRLPTSGVFKLQILDSDQEWLCSYKLISDEEADEMKPFPVDAVIGFGPSQITRVAGIKCNCTSGILNVVKLKDITVNFQFNEPLDVHVELINVYLEYGQLQNSLRCELTDNNLSVTVTIPENGEYALLLHARQKGSKEEFINVCNYLLRTQQKMKTMQNIESEQKVIQDTVTTEKSQNNKLHGPGKVNKQKPSPDLHQLDHADNKEIQNAAVGGEEMHKIVMSLKTAIETRDLEVLEKAIDYAKKSDYSFQKEVQKHLQMAEDTFDRIKRIKKHAHSVLALNQQTISELHRYKNPLQIVHDCMKATYILLGETDATVKKWENIQNLMRKTGMESLIIRIKKFDTVMIQETIARKVLYILNSYDKETATVASAGAGTFYVWAFNVAQDIVDEQAAKGN